MSRNTSAKLRTTTQRTNSPKDSKEKRNRQKTIASDHHSKTEQIPPSHYVITSVLPPAATTAATSTATARPAHLDTTSLSTGTHRHKIRHPLRHRIRTPAFRTILTLLARLRTTTPRRSTTITLSILTLLCPFRRLLPSANTNRQISAHFSISVNPLAQLQTYDDPPRSRSSGTRVADAGLIKAGNRQLRATLMEAAHRLIRFDLYWVNFAAELLARGKPKCLVVAAVANRWMRRLFHDLQPDRLAA